MPDRLYLDHAATTPPTAAARAAVADAMLRWANPSSPHAEGRAARAALEAARGAVAAAYDWPGEVILTSGATESLALALTRANVARRVASAVEHDAVLRAGVPLETLPVGADGLLEAQRVSTALDTNGVWAGDRSPLVPNAVEAPARALVCVQWCNSETGVRQPIAALAAAVHAAGGLLLLDAAQLPAGADPAAVAAADFVALSAHKRGGPPGVGALLVRDLSTLAPTGGQERGYRAGTENPPGVAGYAAALADAEPLARWAELRARLDDAIRRSGGEVVADASPRHAAIASYRMPGVVQAAQLIQFDLAGIAVSAGSACSSGSLKPSHVLTALGWPEAKVREVVRVSFGRDTTAADIDAFVAQWRAIQKRARARAA